MNTIKLSDGYNGDFVECEIEPVEKDGSTYKLRVKDSYLFKWCTRKQWEDAIISGGGHKMYFNTGVRPENRLNLSGENKGKLVLSEHEALKNGTIQIVYYLEEEPKDNYRLLWLCQKDYIKTMPEYKKAIKIIGGGMLSDYAIFQVM